MAVSILHVGCGNVPLPAWLSHPDGTDEIRLDINPDMDVDIVASMTEMGDIGPFDMVYSSHCLEHLYPHDVRKALRECLRVLRPGGACIHVVPDLEDVKCNTDVVYMSLSGPVTGLDMFYGLQSCLEANPYMAHHTGFVKETLKAAFDEAGFAGCDVMRAAGIQLVALARK